MALAACGGSSHTEADRERLIDQVVADAAIERGQAACVIDLGLADYSVEELESLSGNQPNVEVLASLSDYVADCLDEGGKNPLAPSAVLAGASAGAPNGSPASFGGAEAPAVVVQQPSDEYCAASTDAWLAYSVIDSIDAANPLAVDLMMSELGAALASAITLAPDAASAANPIILRDALDRIVAAYEASGSDWQSFQGTQFFDAVAADIETMVDGGEQLAASLAQDCGVDVGDLEPMVEALAAQITTEATPITGGGFMTVSDPSLAVTVEVPVHWVDQWSDPTVAGADLYIAPDVDRYAETWAVDGMRVRVDSANGGDFDVWEATSETDAFADCELRATDPFEETFVGVLYSYDCSGTSAFVLAATDAVYFQTEVLVEIQVVDPAAALPIVSAVLDSMHIR